MATKMINSLKFGSDTHPFTLPYGTATISGTAISVDVDNFSLETGARVLVKFPSDVEMKGATLNVESTGAKTIRNPDDMTLGQKFVGGKVYEFVYDGTNYEPIIAPMGWNEIGIQGNRPNIQAGRLSIGGDYKGWVRIIQWASPIGTGQTFNLMLTVRASSFTQSCMFNVCIPKGTENTCQIAQIQGCTSSDASNWSAHVIRKLRIVQCSNGDCYLEYYLPPTESVVNASMTLLARIDGQHGECLTGKLIVGGEVETESNPTVIAEVDVVRNIHPVARTVLYEVDPSNQEGIYCNGKTAADSENSVIISDPNKVYKRLKLSAHAPYGMMTVDFDLSGEPQSAVTGNNTNVLFGTNRHGSFIGFGADHDTGNPANKHIMYQINFSVTEVTEGWRVQVIESGWLGFGIPALSSTDYSNNITTKKSGTEYPHWNQRHNNNYVIYKIVGYTD